MFNKKKLMGGNRFMGGVIIAGVIITVAVVGMMYYPKTFRVPYSAVFTLSGEFYVGHLFRWPFSSTLRLSDVYVLQNVQDVETNETRPQLTPLATESLWQPKTIYFNRKNIVFTGKVSWGSQIGQALQAAALAPAQAQPQQQIAPTN